MRRVFLVDSEFNTTSMQAVVCKDESRELQDLLERNYDLLAGEQINPEDPRRWLLVKREMPVPGPNSASSRWSVDFVFVDQDGWLTFVECKRFEDTRSRREVVGQMMEYAANGRHYWDKSTLIEYARGTAAKAGKDLDESLRQLRGDPAASVDELFEQVENNLREGQIRLVFFMEEAPRELKSIVEFMNEQMKSVELLIVEARQYEREKTRVVAPILFGYTEEARASKRIVSLVPAQTRVTWDREKILNQAKRSGGESREHAFQRVFDTVDEHPDLLRVGFGRGQTGSLIVRNDQDVGLLYIYTNGTVQMAAACHYPSRTERIAAIATAEPDKWTWSGPIVDGKYPGLTKSLEALGDDKLAVFLAMAVNLGQELRGVERE